MTRTLIIGGIIPAAVFAVTFLFRWVTLDFDNDYFMHVAWAAEMVGGGWPVRDFVEPGFILQTFVSYAGFRIGGYQLFWEGVFASACMAASATFLYLTCRRVGIPRGWAFLATVLAVASYPRLYAYPKALVYPAALWALAVYIGRPARASLVLLSSITAVAFLFRHDHAVWIGAAASIGLFLRHSDDLKTGMRAAVAYGATALLLVTPWLAWVAASGQAAQYFGFLTGQSQGLVANRIVPDRTFAIDTAMPLVTLAPIGYPRVGIRWAAGISEDEQRERERRYGLEPLPQEDRYRLTNVDTTNVRSLVQDPAVEDTSGIDRSSLRVPSGLFPWLYLTTERYFPPLRVRILPGAATSANAQAWLTWVTFVAPWIVLAWAGIILAAALIRTGRTPVVSGFDRTRAARDSSRALVVSGFSRTRWRAVVSGFKRTRPVSDADSVVSGFSRTDDRSLRSLIIPAALLAVITYQTLVRGSPDSRLGDVAPITALLLAWMATQAWNTPGRGRLLLGPAATVFLVVTLSAAASYGEVLTRLSDAGVDGPINLVRRARDVGTRYGRPPIDVFAPPGSTGLAGLSRWLNDCTDERDRVSVIGFEPQVFVVSDRGFAGGMVFYDLAWASTEYDQRLTIDRWKRQDVPVVLAMASEWDALARDYPSIRGWIDERYETERRSTFGGNKELTVLRDRSRAVNGVHQATGLPCFIAQEAR